MSFANPWMLALFAPLLIAAWRLLRRGRKAGNFASAIKRDNKSPNYTTRWSDIIEVE